jgi:hypothetical protein
MGKTHTAAHRRRLAVVVVPAGLTLIAMTALAGCSGSSASSSSSANSAGNGLAAAPSAVPSAAASASAAAGAPAAAGTSGFGNGGSAQAQSAARLAPAAQQIIYTAQLTVRASSVPAAVSRATSIVTGAGGYVSSENATSNPDHPSQATATITLKIPVAVYAATLAQLSSGLGTQLSLQQQAQDVTQQVADVSSRVASDQAAIVQLRALLKHAGSVGDLLSVQDQINSEESDLEAMLAQQSALNHETSYATITITVLGPKAPKVVAKPAKPKSPPGFANGVSGGWRAFRTSVSWFLAILGAVAPFAAVVALLSALAYWIRRRHTRRRPTA